MTENNDCIYLVDQTANYNPSVKKYALYKTAYEASLHGTLAAVQPFETSRKFPSGTQGVDWVLYDHVFHTKSNDR